MCVARARGHLWAAYDFLHVSGEPFSHSAQRQFSWQSQHNPICIALFQYSIAHALRQTGATRRAEVTPHLLLQNNRMGTAQGDFRNIVCKSTAGQRQRGCFRTWCAPRTCRNGDGEPCAQTSAVATPHWVLEHCPQTASWTQQMPVQAACPRKARHGKAPAVFRAKGSY